MFTKVDLLLKITGLNDFETIQYISKTYFLISLITLWLVTLTVFLLIMLSTKNKKPLTAFIIAMIVNLILSLLIIFGFFPALLILP